MADLILRLVDDSDDNFECSPDDYKAGDDGNYATVWRDSPGVWLAAWGYKGYCEAEAYSKEGALEKLNKATGRTYVFEVE
jgi:hypothetical protein